MTLNARQIAFAREYILDFNGTKAAIRAGYARKSAGQMAYDLLKKPEIQTAIEDAKKARLARLDFDADQLLLDLVDEHRADMADLYDPETGNLLPIHEWPLVFRRGLVAGIEVEELFEGRGEDREHIGTLRKIKLADRHKIKDMLGKHIGVQAFKERREIDVPEDSPLARLARELEGTTLRPRVPGGEGDD